jgi:hypothetical protein
MKLTAEVIDHKQARSALESLWRVEEMDDVAGIFGLLLVPGWEKLVKD